MRARLATRCIVAGAAILLCATGCGGGGGSSSAAAEQRAREAKAAAQLRRAEARQAKLQAAVRRERARLEQGGRESEGPAGSGGGSVLPASAQGGFAQLARSLGGRVGVSISGPGQADGQQLGDLAGGVAWSSIKVALAQAALDAGRATGGDVTAAITASDNAAAERLWAALGSGERAARAVQAVLAAAGDTSTVVNAQRTRPGFTAFGQTQWSLDAQRRFMAGYLCSHRDSEVVRLMQQVVPGQRWGLGSVGRPAGFKGGWGPAPSGPYLVRQMGWLDLGGGRTVVVAMATIAPSGTYEAGAAALSRVAQWVRDAAARSGARPGSCPR